MKRSEIIKIYGTEYKELTIRLLKEADLEAEIFRKWQLDHRKKADPHDMKIGIKPNLVSPTPAEYGATTHVEVVDGIVSYLKRQGFADLVILESSWVGDKTTDAYEYCGYRQLCERHQIPFWDMQQDASHKVDCKGLELELCDQIDELDFMINVPVLKGHCQTKITCALKNMKGLIPNKEKRHFHAMGLHKPIAHLNVGLHQDFIVVDHICGDLDFEDGGNPVIRNCIMAALDPVLVDSYVCQLLHYEVSEVPYIVMAEQLGVGSTDLAHAQIHVIGEQQEKELPRGRKVVDVQDAVEEVESCSACYAALIPALDRLRQDGVLDYVTEKIAIGQGYRGKHGAIGVGMCTAGFDFCIKGCPPEEDDVYKGLKKYFRIG